MTKPVKPDYGELADLIEAVKKLPPITTRQQQEARLSWAYGNLLALSHHKPQLASFRSLALALNWTIAEFDAWAKGREWFDAGGISSRS